MVESCLKTLYFKVRLPANLSTTGRTALVINTDKTLQESQDDEAIVLKMKDTLEALVLDDILALKPLDVDSFMSEEGNLK